MKLLNIFKKTHDNILYSICKGKTFPIEEVADEVFSQKMLGDGIAFHLDDDLIYSPADGEIIFFADTKHAIGIKTSSGIEIMLHIGLNTVELKGEGFEYLVKTKKIKKRTPLLKIDLEFMKKHQVDLTSLLIITDSNNRAIIRKKYDDVTLNDIVLELD